MDNKTVEIVDSLLVLITIDKQFITGWHLDKVLESMSKHPYIINAAKYLKTARLKKFSITLSNSDLIDLIDKK